MKLRGRWTTLVGADTSTSTSPKEPSNVPTVLLICGAMLTALVSVLRDEIKIGRSA